MQAQQVPHGDRGRRVRRHRRTGHPRGPHRGARRRDRRRVRPRGAHDRAPGRRQREGAGPHGRRRGQRAARRRAPGGRLGHDRRPHVPPARPRARGGRDDRRSTATSSGPSRCNGRRIGVVRTPTDRGSACGRRSRRGSGGRPRGPPTRFGRTRRGPPAAATRSRRHEVRLRLARGPPQRGQVHPAQRHPRHQGHHHLGQAPDHALAGPGHPQPARRPGRVRRHAGHPQAPHPARRAAQRHRQQRHLRGRRGVPGGRRHRFHRPR